MSCGTKPDWDGELVLGIDVEISCKITCSKCKQVIREFKVPEVMVLENSVWIPPDGVGDSPVCIGHSVGSWIGMWCNLMRKRHVCELP